MGWRQPQLKKRPRRLPSGSWRRTWTAPSPRGPAPAPASSPPSRTRRPSAPSSFPRTRRPTSASGSPRDGRPETWRHDLGGKGACANQCCEFKPPLKNPPPPSPQPTWFETFNGDCSNTAAAFNGPTLFRGKDLDAKSICFQLEDGSYELREGFLGNCGGPCCIFYGEAAERK